MTSIPVAAAAAPAVSPPAEPPPAATGRAFVVDELTGVMGQLAKGGPMDAEIAGAADARLRGVYEPLMALDTSTTRHASGPVDDALTAIGAASSSHGAIADGSAHQYDTPGIVGSLGDALVAITQLR